MDIYDEMDKRIDEIVDQIDGPNNDQNKDWADATTALKTKVEELRVKRIKETSPEFKEVLDLINAHGHAVKNIFLVDYKDLAFE